MLDPGLAFGTGTHPTTFLCMQWLARQTIVDKTVVDYGCGSGILGVTALLLGAKHVEGIDIDPQALTATKDNVRRNGLASERFVVFLPEAYRVQNTVDMVLANILAGPLRELKNVITAFVKPGGQLALSGILNEQAESVRKAYDPLITLDPTLSDEDWCRVSGTRSSD